jgi:hypothetical protein
MEVFPLILLFTLIILSLFITSELILPNGLNGFVEGFTTGITTNHSYWSSFISARSDIDSTQEDASYIRDPRYFNDYADVSRIGMAYDFCRMVATKSEPDNLFFACALAGTENLDSIRFRTPGTKDGFRISYDDYMRDTNGDGRAEYCRIIPWKDGSFQPVCSYAGDMGFDGTEKVDSDPPEKISTLLEFYDGCVMWLRFKGDMIDMIKNVKTQIAGKLIIDETPRRDKAEGLEFNGINQFIRVSDSSDLSVGFNMPMRSVRSWMTWVFFDDFTNNAKIFDFGNGAGKDNVFLGILAKGDSAAQGSDLRPLLCGTEESTVPTKEEKSGAQPVLEMSPKRLMETTDANVNEYTCPGFSEIPDIKTPSHVKPKGFYPQPLGKATLLFEIWDKQSRKMRIKVPGAIPKKRWTHITITTTSDDAFRPNISIYINAKKVFEKESGWLPAASSMTNCYIGKSNWSSSSQYENRDELFKGRIFDLRAYKKSLSEGMIQDSFDWGQSQLGESLPSV